MNDAPQIDLRVAGLARRFGPVVALEGVDLEVRRGELVSLLGPSGCGKSTLLQLIAGHLVPDAGTIEIGGHTGADASGALVAPQRRGVGMVFQDYALFPHLTVAQNVAFGLARTGRGLRLRAARSGEATRVRELLTQFGIPELAARYPGELSGGQQQRVAIARAVAQRPRLLLLDEPFCNLDVASREHVRGEIVELLRATGLTCLFVTHDQEEALAISDRIAVMRAGRVMQIDAPEVLYRRPLCMEVAESLGRTNVLRGVAAQGRVRTEAGSFDISDAPTGQIEVLVRPELLDLRPARDGNATVIAREFRGHDVLYTLRMRSGTLVWAHRPSTTMAAVGERVRIHAQPGAAAFVGQSPAPAAPSPGTLSVARFSDSTAPAFGRITSSHSGGKLMATSTSAGSAASE